MEQGYIDLRRKKRLFGAHTVLKLKLNFNITWMPILDIPQKSWGGLFNPILKKNTVFRRKGSQFWRLTVLKRAQCRVLTSNSHFCCRRHSLFTNIPGYNRLGLKVIFKKWLDPAGPSPWTGLGSAGWSRSSEAVSGRSIIFVRTAL